MRRDRGSGRGCPTRTRERRLAWGHLSASPATGRARGAVRTDRSGLRCAQCSGEAGSGQTVARVLPAPGRDRPVTAGRARSSLGRAVRRVSAFRAGQTVQQPCQLDQFFFAEPLLEEVTDRSHVRARGFLELLAAAVREDGVNDAAVRRAGRPGVGAEQPDPGLEARRSLCSQYLTRQEFSATVACVLNYSVLKGGCT